MVQRLLAAKTEGESRAALFSSWLVILVQFTMFLLIGLMLHVYYTDNGIARPAVADQIYPRFIWDQLPHGISGLIMAAILAAAMSNLSAALNALASTTIMDFYKVLRPAASESHFLAMARYATVVWGAVLVVIGFLARQWGSVLEAGLGIASIVYGGLLGVFLLGLLTRRVGEKAAMAGMTAGLLTMFYVKFGTKIAFTWYVMIGASVTFLTGILVSYILSEKSTPTETLHG
jgi:Na+/proline symporter